MDQPGTNILPGLQAILKGIEIDTFIFQTAPYPFNRHTRSIKTLSIHRPLPSMDPKGSAEQQQKITFHSQLTDLGVQVFYFSCMIILLDIRFAGKPAAMDARGRQGFSF